MEESKKRNLTFREYTPEGGEPIGQVQDRVERFFQVSILCIIAIIGNFELFSEQIEILLKLNVMITFFT
jgi:hypothetical protein